MQITIPISIGQIEIENTEGFAGIWSPLQILNSAIVVCKAKDDMEMNRCAVFQ